MYTHIQEDEVFNPWSDPPQEKYTQSWHTLHQSQLQPGSGWHSLTQHWILRGSVQDECTVGLTTTAQSSTHDKQIEEQAPFRLKKLQEEDTCEHAWRWSRAWLDKSPLLGYCFLLLVHTPEDKSHEHEEWTVVIANATHSFLSVTQAKDHREMGELFLRGWLSRPIGKLCGTTYSIHLSNFWRRSPMRVWMSVCRVFQFLFLGFECTQLGRRVQPKQTKIEVQ